MNAYISASSRASAIKFSDNKSYCCLHIKLILDFGHAPHKSTKIIFNIESGIL